MDSLLILTGASGSGKTTLARAAEAALPRCQAFFFDSIGVPSKEVLATYDHENDGPGGGWQRAMTTMWIQRIAPMRRPGESLLLEGQMRIAFIAEAMRSEGLADARVMLLDCRDSVRAARLRENRRQPDLASEDMMRWAEFLRNEAIEYGYDILDTGSYCFDECLDRILAYLR
jgi:energy-coupling factor transporter ATP-binding protein EcfA2